MLCCIVFCYIALCYFMIRSTALRRAVVCLRRATLLLMLNATILWYVTLHCAILSCIVLSYAMPFYGVLFYAVLYDIIVCHNYAAVLCPARLCYMTIYCVVLPYLSSGFLVPYCAQNVLLSM